MRLPVTSTSNKPPVQVNSVKTVNPVNPTTPSRPTSTKLVAQLIGKRCMVACAINGVLIQMLLDSGAHDYGGEGMGRESIAKCKNRATLIPVRRPTP